MTPLGIVEAREEIKALKARYFRLVDAKLWDEWGREIFCEDAVFTFDGMKTEPIQGIAAILAWVRPRVEGAITVHHGHMPEITVLSDDEAEGVWAMEDWIIRPRDDKKPSVHGFGHYHERYRRTPAGWRIQKMHLARLHLERWTSV